VNEGDRMLRLIIPNDFDYAKASLRDKIQYTLHQKGWKHIDLALATGIHKAVMSQLMNGKKRFSIEQIDRITEALGLSKGELYPDFISECYNGSGKLKTSKCEKFLREAVKIHDKNLFMKIVNMLLEESNKNIKIVFDVAEEMYHSKRYVDSIPLYQLITASIYNRFDSKLSLSYFRLFMIARHMMLEDSHGVKNCKNKLLVMLDYLELLPVEYKLDGYIEVIVFYNLIEDYTNTLKYADKLIKEVEILSENVKNNKLDYNVLMEYYYEALLYKGFAYKGMGKYELSLNTIKKYSNYNDRYNRFAKGNECLVRILLGEWDCVQVYLENSTNEKKELIIFPVLAEASVKHSNFDKLNEFLSTNNDIFLRFDNDTTSIGLKHKMIAYHNVAEFYIKTGQTQVGIEYLLKAMHLASYFQNETRFNQCWLLYTNYCQYATCEQKEKFNQIVERTI
jgi:transcriptional regulator with XRE-family HTH domain